jgi:hypothetical protein
MSQNQQIANYLNYSISKDGNVINNKFKRKLKPFLDAYGYYQVCLCNKGQIKKFRVNRLVAEAFIPNTNNYKQVNHINGIKTDNRIENLEWVTPSQNMLHAYKIGLKKVTNKNIKASRLANSKVVLDTKTGIFYDSAKEAATLLGLNKQTLYCYLLGYNTNKTSLIYA